MVSDQIGSIVVRIPDRFRTSPLDIEFAEASGTTVREVLDSIKGRYPDLHRSLITPDGELNDRYSIFVGTTGNKKDLNVYRLQGLDTHVSRRDIVSIGNRRHRSRKRKTTKPSSNSQT